MIPGPEAARIKFDGTALTDMRDFPHRTRGDLVATTQWSWSSMQEHWERERRDNEWRESGAASNGFELLTK